MTTWKRWVGVELDEVSTKAVAASRALDSFVDIDEDDLLRLVALLSSPPLPPTARARREFAPHRPHHRAGYPRRSSWGEGGWR